MVLHVYQLLHTLKRTACQHSFNGAVTQMAAFPCQCNLHTTPIDVLTRSCPIAAERSYAQRKLPKAEEEVH